MEHFMIETEVRINGMMCGMCEAHVNDAIRKAFDVKKVSSSHKKGLMKIVSEHELSPEAIKEALKDTGYEIGSIESHPYVKKGLFG